MSLRRSSPGLALLGLGLLAALGRPASADPSASVLDLKRGQEATFGVTIADGKATLGPPLLTRPGTAEPKDGEISVGVVTHGLSPYADLTVTEKTPVPVDFVATGVVGGIKIDEVVVCGRIDAPTLGRIASGSWRVSLSRFTVHPTGDASSTEAKPAEGDLGCPR